MDCGLWTLAWAGDYAVVNYTSLCLTSGQTKTRLQEIGSFQSATWSHLKPVTPPYCLQLPKTDAKQHVEKVTFCLASSCVSAVRMHALQPAMPNRIHCIPQERNPTSDKKNASWKMLQFRHRRNGLFSNQGLAEWSTSCKLEAFRKLPKSKNSHSLQEDSGLWTVHCFQSPPRMDYQAF